VIANYICGEKKKEERGWKKSLKTPNLYKNTERKKSSDGLRKCKIQNIKQM
jgi:hypothetical protein